MAGTIEDMTDLVGRKRLPNIAGTPIVAVFAALLCALGFAATTALAQQAGGEGTLKAVGSSPLPPGTAVSVIAEQFTDVNTRLQEVIEQALVARGYRIDQNAEYQLSYDTEINAQTQVLTPGMDETATEVGAADEDLDTSMGYQDRDESGDPLPDSVLPEQVQIPFGGSAGGSGQSDYSLSFVLGRNGYPPVWQGAVTAAMPTESAFDAARVMVPPLVDSIGTSVDGKQVRLGP